VHLDSFNWRHYHPAGLAVFVLTCQSLTATTASAAERVYTLVTGDSHIAISGTVTTTFGSAPIQPQGPGGASASYSGFIRTDRGEGSIQFLSGSDIDANVTGSWQPLADGNAGAALADYGLRVSYLGGLISANVAGRDLAAGFTSGILPVDGQGDFSLASTTVTFIDGSIAYRATTGQFGSESVSGEDGTLSGTASLSTSSSGGTPIEILSIPVNATIPFVIDANTSVNLILTGQLIASALLPPDLPGDHNDDGTVDAADYVAWSKGVDVASTPENYELWRTNFGRSQVEDASAAAPAVPEPNSLRLLALVGIVFAESRRRVRANK
jgi:hypothetical protein